MNASMDLLRQSSESLAGRISYLEMVGLNVLEVGGSPNSLRNLWLKGGFPDSYLTKNDNQSMDWLEDLIRTYLERDVPQLGFRIPSGRLRRLWTMVAHLQGEPINYSKLGSNLEVDAKTVQFYLDVLEDLLLIRRHLSWHGNTKKRLVKAPRYYVKDSGVLQRLLGISNYDELLSHPALGKSWEGFVIENIHSVLPQRAETYFYRTAAGAEIDLILKLPGAKTWAVEIKFGISPKISPHFEKSCDELGASDRYIIYSGEEEFPYSSKTWVVSLSSFLKKFLP